MKSDIHLWPPAPLVHLGNGGEQLPLIDRRVVRRCPWRRFWRPIQRRHISERRRCDGLKTLKRKVKFHYPPIRGCWGLFACWFGG